MGETTKPMDKSTAARLPSKPIHTEKRARHRLRSHGHSTFQQHGCSGAVRLRISFPMSQAYMFDLPTALGVPRNALNLIQALYDNNRCTVQTNGAQVDGFKMTAGVRQGCPLSPLLYAICA